MRQLYLYSSIRRIPMIALCDYDADGYKIRSISSRFGFVEPTPQELSEFVGIIWTQVTNRSASPNRSVFIAKWYITEDGYLVKIPDTGRFRLHHGLIRKQLRTRELLEAFLSIHHL